MFARGRLSQPTRIELQTVRRAGQPVFEDTIHEYPACRRQRCQHRTLSRLLAQRGHSIRAVPDGLKALLYLGERIHEIQAEFKMAKIQ